MISRAVAIPVPLPETVMDLSAWIPRGNAVLTPERRRFPKERARVFAGRLGGDRQGTKTGLQPGQPRNDDKETAVEIIGVIIAGIIIGLLGKFVAPGDRDNIPLWLTVICGIGGVIIGYYLAGALGVDDTSGIDWIRWIISILVAAVLVVIAATVTGRRTGRKI
jgi:uncharacterized membrane protein YeaQ/YmgE (transglycosylase-associated protein family)